MVSERNILGAKKFDRDLLLCAAALCVTLLNVAVFCAKQRFRSGISDFKMYYAGALIVQSNLESKLYDYNLQAQTEQQLFPGTTRRGEALPYNHPPFELLLFLPLTRLSYIHAGFLWLAITVSLGILCAHLLARELNHISDFWRPMPYALVLCLFPFLIVLLQQQDSVLALLVLIACWLSLKGGRDSRAGFLLGLGLFRFQIFIPLAVLLAVWKPKILRGFGLSAALVGIVSLIMIHPEGLVEYFRFLGHMASDSATSVSNTYQIDPRTMPNLRGLAYGLLSRGAPATTTLVARILLLVLVLVSGLIFFWAIHQLQSAKSIAQKNIDLAFGFTVTVGLLLSFHLLMHDLTLLALPFAILVNRFVAPGTRWGPRQSAISGLIALFYLTPIYFVLYPDRIYLLGAAVFGCALLTSMELSEADRFTHPVVRLG